MPELLLRSSVGIRLRPSGANGMCDGVKRHGLEKQNIRAGVTSLAFGAIGVRGAEKDGNAAAVAPLCRFDDRQSRTALPVGELQVGHHRVVFPERRQANRH